MTARRTLEAQLAEVQREIAMRRNVYPGLVNRRKMREGEAAEKLLLMECVRDTLELILSHRETINQAIKKGGK